jgi:hypothetical protein
MLNEMNEEATRFYGGMMSAVGRMLPTYPRHARRRAFEMHELEEASRSAGQEPCVLAAVHQLMEQLASAPFDSSSNSDWTIPAIVEYLIKNEFLAGAVPSEASSS